MFTHKLLTHFLVSMPFLIFMGCASSYAPTGYLPPTDEIPEEVHGGWITIITAPDKTNSDEKWMIYGGEFIATEDSVIYILYDSLYQIPKWKITNSTLELDEKNTGVYGAWVVGGSLLTISNGYYSVITFPLWLVGGIPAASGESIRDRYEMEYPDEQYWNDIKKFGRFPQGISDIDLNQIKPLTFSNVE